MREQSYSSTFPPRSSRPTSRATRGRNAEAFHIKPGRGPVHHFDGTAREAEWHEHEPEGTLERPVDEVVDFGDGVFDFVIDGDFACSCEKSSTPSRRFS